MDPLPPLPEDTSSARLAEEWTKLCHATPALLSATIHPCLSRVTAKYSQRDPTTSTSINFQVSYIAPDFHSAGPQIPAPKSFTSPSGKYHAEFQSGDDGVIIRVWENECTMNVWVVPKHVHGGLYDDPFFGGLSWSMSEEYFVYVADRQSVDEPSKGLNPKQKWKVNLRTKFDEDARTPLGEAYVNQRRPGLYIGHIKKEKSWALAENDKWMFGDPQCGQTGIVATVRSLAPDGNIDMDLGLRHCYNRSAKVVIIDHPSEGDETPQKFRFVSGDSVSDFCCHSPRLSRPDNPLSQVEEEIVYLAAPRKEDPDQTLPHNTANLLRYISVSKDGVISKPRTIVHVPQHPRHDEFPGLYLLGLPRNPWLSKNTLAFSIIWGSVYRLISFVFPRQEGELQPQGELYFWTIRGSNLLSYPYSPDKFADMDEYSVSLCDTEGGALLFARSSPAVPSTLFVTTGDSDGHYTLKQVSPQVPQTNLSVTARTTDLVARNPHSRNSNILFPEIFDPAKHEAHTRFQITLVQSDRDEGSSRKLVVFPHGGPHVSNINTYSIAVTALLQCGFDVMYINYRGSLGLGQKSLESLLGNIGTQDVNEVAQATRWAKKEHGYEDEYFIGGSHSGFLGAHLSLLGLYKRIVLRNPVVDLSSMMGSTDIPDWCFAETGLKGGKGLGPTKEVLERLLEVSPVAYLNEAIEKGSRPTATLLQVGGGDKRVPPAQSLLWKRMVNAVWPRTVCMRWYPESGHGIVEVPQGDDSWVSALKFLVDGRLEDREAVKDGA